MKKEFLSLLTAQKMPEERWKLYCGIQTLLFLRTMILSEGNQILRNPQMIFGVSQSGKRTDVKK